MILSHMLNIVILMAGAGSRFKKEGFDKAKPFITFHNKMMIEHVLDSFSLINARCTLIIQEAFRHKYAKELNILHNQYNVNFATVPGLTMGASVTAMAVHRQIDHNSPVIFADSDNIFQNSIIKNFVEYSATSSLDGIILTFKSAEPHFSYSKIDAQGFLIQTKEKEIISEYANCGVYYFKSFKIFQQAAIEMFIASDTHNGEFYISNIYNYLLKNSYTAGIYTIEHSDFRCVGTPQQLQGYLYEVQ